MARNLEEQIPATTRNFKRRTFNISIQSELNKEFVAQAGREEYDLADGVPTGSPKRFGVEPVQFIGSEVAGLSVTLANSKVLTFAEIAEAVALFIDKVEETQEG